MYVAGSTESANFGFGGAPGFDQTLSGNSDWFVLRLGPTCSPRPPVSVSVERAGDGRLGARITVADALNSILSVRSVRTTGALLDLPSGEGQSGAFTYTPPAGTTSMDVFVRLAPGSSSATAELVVTDGGGEWPAFLGGGASAF